MKNEGVKNVWAERGMVLWMLVAFAGAGCASGSPAPGAAPAAQPAVQATAAATAQAAPALPESIRWVQSSAEYMALTVQTYRIATARVEAAARGRAAGSWAVVLDADETVLNNTPYQAGLAQEGAKHTTERFTAWVRKKAATPVPGAADFLARVHELGGRIAIVTNRLQIECDDTAENLRMNALPFDTVLCRPDGAPTSAPKTPRFDAVAAGQTAASRTPVEILAFVGDNILDFPGTAQAMRAQGVSAFTEFGVRWFILPNPMYGSWQ